MPRRRPANYAGSPAMLGPGGTRQTRSLWSLRHAARLFPPAPALLGAFEADGCPPRVRCMSRPPSARDESKPRRRRRRVSQPRTRHSGSACLSDRRERVRNRPVVIGNRGEKRREPDRRLRQQPEGRRRRPAALLGYFLGRQEVTRISRRSRRRNGICF